MVNYLKKGSHCYSSLLNSSTMAQWLALMPHSRRVLSLNPGPFCVEFACFPRACVTCMLGLVNTPVIAPD